MLNHAGHISHEQALKKTIKEYDKYKQLHINDQTQVEKDFEDLLKKTNRWENYVLKFKKTESYVNH